MKTFNGPCYIAVCNADCDYASQGWNEQLLAGQHCNTPDNATVITADSLEELKVKCEDIGIILPQADEGSWERVDVQCASAFNNSQTQ